MVNGQRSKRRKDERTAFLKLFIHLFSSQQLDLQIVLLSQKGSGRLHFRGTPPAYSLGLYIFNVKVQRFYSFDPINHHLFPLYSISSERFPP